jgi:hypothetical protein
MAAGVIAGRRVTDGECWECGAPFRSDNTTGYCSPCRARLQCSVCEEPCPDKRGRVCAECRAVYDLIDARRDGNKYRAVPPDLERRLECFAARASAGAPLFDSLDAPAAGQEGTP